MNKLIAIIVVVLLIAAGIYYLYKIGEVQTQEITIVNNDGKEVGVARLNETRIGVLIGLELRGLKSNGTHAIHIHEKADCTPLDSFKNAGGHFNPEDASHGMKHVNGHHAGDMPNLKANSQGRIITQILNRKITMLLSDTSDGRYSIFDRDGSAIVVHADADDHKSQPSGAAGKRILCGEID